MKELIVSAGDLAMQIDLATFLGSAFAATAIGCAIIIIEWQREIRKYNDRNN